MPKTTVYAVRDAESKERLTYRYRKWDDAKELIRRFDHTGRAVEVYRTSQDLPRQSRRA